MILTDYYCFEHKADTKSKTRIDCVTSTESYPQFEALRNKENILFLYVGDNTHTKAGKELKADLALTKTKHVSSIYRPDVTNGFAYGDINHTADAILFVFHDFSITNGRIKDGARIEIFVARGYRNDRANLYTMLLDGELSEEMFVLRNKAKKQFPI